MNRKTVLAGVAVLGLILIVAAVAFWVMRKPSKVETPAPEPAGKSWHAIEKRTRRAKALEAKPQRVPAKPIESEPARVPAAPRVEVETVVSPNPVETPEEEESRRVVDAFDTLVDEWREPKPEGVTSADMETFVNAFKRIPKEFKDEEIHRALNLVPDENILLLAAVLFDKSEDKEILDTIFNDILNRPEDVKEPILQMLFKDKEHPCWTDSAWILDVTS